MYYKRLAIFACLYCLITGVQARTPAPASIQSSFKSCQEKNITLSSNGNHFGDCNQGSSESFSALAKIMKVGFVLEFQKKIKDAVHTKIEFKIFETEMLEACYLQKY
jgi:hypothetical protein